MIPTVECDLGADYRRDPALARRLMKPHHAVQSAVVGERQRPVSQIERLLDQVLRVGSAVEKREVRVTVQLDIRVVWNQSNTPCTNHCDMSRSK